MDGFEIMDDEIDEMKIPGDPDEVVTSPLEPVIISRGMGWLERDGANEDIGEDVLKSPSL